MAKDTSGITAGIMNQTFIQGEKVMVRRLGDGNEYRAKVVGVAVDMGGYKAMIIEIIDSYRNYEFSHAMMLEVCIDKETW